MSKIHILDSYYKNGHSRVVKSSPYGVVKGYAELDKEDEAIANQWDGCKIAEMRADLEIQKRRTKKLNHRAIVVDEIVNYMLKEFYLYPDRYESIEDVKVLLDKIWRSARKQARDNQKKIVHMEESLPAKIDALLEERHAVREQIEKVRNMRENKK